MKLLTFSTLYPNAEQISHGIFVETRLRYLVASGMAEARVVAPVPWFPLRHARFGRYGSFARIPATETRQGLFISHPRYALIPKIGMHLAPFMMAQSLKPAIAKIIRDGDDFDLIDAHYFYPDGVAAVMLGKHFNKPVVITARGSDINLIGKNPLARKKILWAADNAAGVITVCAALKNELVKMGANASHITPLRNGVDLQRFHCLDKRQIRTELGLSRFTLLTGGALTENKGHHIAIQALVHLPDVELMIVGSGPDLALLHTLAINLKVADRVKFIGALAQPELIRYYNAADLMVLMSAREGWANVLLESMACGTPAIATDVGGSSEVITAKVAGLLVEERTAPALAAAVTLLRSDFPARTATRHYAEKYSWDDTTQGQLNLFNAILKGSAPW
jgi:glycosyltransferase involved in cell wall biosynthesis